ncbi:hypothetical protein [Cystobacter fuscus]|uniref:hypothetical protein n=1 Tax=Cystobacter fuscus TaxID=43 RepID=UPI002B2E70FF|nr:hypothetical protein F0U63_13860 [Cystobacter fuscus]
MLPLLLSATLLGATPTAPAEFPATESVPRVPMRSRAPLVAGIGAGFTLTGTLVWLVSNVQEGSVASLPVSPAEVQVERWKRQQTQLGGIGLALVGVCTVGIAAAMWNWAPGPARAVSAAPLLLPGGGGVALGGTWP